MSDPLRAAHLGIRPDAPRWIASETTLCKQLEEEIEYTTQLQEAYHTRASWNRNAIYLAGILALGTTAATGGMAAAGVAATAVAATALAGGFTSGAFALVNNSALASSYTDAANDLATALESAKVGFAAGLGKNDAASFDPCGPAFNTLVAARTTAQNSLESARSNAAAAAAIQAAAQLERLDTHVSEARASLLSSRLSHLSVVTKSTVEPNPCVVELILSGVDLSGVAFDVFQLSVGSSTFGATSIDRKSANEYVLRFQNPLSNDTGSSRDTSLLVPSANLRFELPKTPTPKDDCNK